MTIDIEKARALCEAATPGEWKWEDWQTPYNEGGVDGPNKFTLTAPPETSPGGKSEMFPDLRNRLIADDDREISEDDRAFIAHARTLLPEALDEIERLRMDLAVCRGNLGAASEHARDTCACKFDPVTEEPVRRCLYHREQADELERLRKIEAAALALTREWPWQENIAPPHNKFYELAETLGI